MEETRALIDNDEEFVKYMPDDFVDSFDFDYHFMWDHYYDFPQYNHAKILSGDIKNLEKIMMDLKKEDSINIIINKLKMYIKIISNS